MTLHLFAIAGIGEVSVDDDIAQIIVDALDDPLQDGDVVVVTSKIVSKAAGLATVADRDDIMDDETDRVVATRGQTRIVRTRQGLTLAAAGIDASNIALGQAISLPRDPDISAHDLRTRLTALTRAVVVVIITDTAGRAWRIGQTDIGAAGIKPHLNFTGLEDAYGNMLAVTAPAIADELAGASDLVAEKLGGNPVVIVRGVPRDWLIADDQVGASSLILNEEDDLFGMGSRDAVLAACGRGAVLRGFPADPENTLEELIRRAQEGVDRAVVELIAINESTLQISSSAAIPGPSARIAVGTLAERLRVLARAMRLNVRIEIAKDKR
ncbi:MAG: coenzyme F420-0:L-glutamate ligase [Actinomycetales bacterium]|nr:coenzyme F420-0:L-glutamate ligase [Actinomycetales bacterium]